MFIWLIWTLMSKKAVKLNQSLTHSLHWILAISWPFRVKWNEISLLLLPKGEGYVFNFVGLEFMSVSNIMEKPIKTCSWSFIIVSPCHKKQLATRHGRGLHSYSLLCSCSHPILSNTLKIFAESSFCNNSSYICWESSAKKLHFHLIKS